MKWSKFIRPLMILLIVLSLFLTWAIWTMPGQYGEQTSSDQKKTSSVTISRQLARVFGPSQVVLHESDTAEITTNRDVLSAFTKAFNSWKLDSLDDPIELTPDEYQAELNHSGNEIELLYFESIPFGVLSNLFANLPGEYQDQTFDRVYLSQSDPDTLYFYNTETKLLYTSTLENVDQIQLSESIHRKDVTYRPVTTVKVADKMIYLPLSSLKLPYLTYMVERQPNSLFIERLFDDTSEVRENRSENAVQYIDYISEMRVNEKTNILNYYRNRNSGDTLSLTRTLMDSFNELMRFENWSDEIHYFDYNHQSNEVTYRRYIEGFPVFSLTGYGATYITVVREGLSQLQVPLVVAQTPISDEGKEKELLSGDELLDTLINYGYAIEKIDDIKIGYTWTNSSESDRVINLEPSWYIYKNGNWTSLQDLIQNGGD